MKNLYILITIFIITALAHFALLYDEYKFSSQPNIAQVTHIEKECGRSCYHYALVNYKGSVQKINIGAINYHHMRIGKYYDFSPSFNWFLGINGTAYSIDRETFWYQGILVKLFFLFGFLCSLGLICFEINSIYSKNKRPLAVI